MEVKVWFCVFVFIISQFCFLKDAAGFGWKRCRNDSDCEGRIRCYEDKCMIPFYKSYGYWYGHRNRTHRPLPIGLCKCSLVTVEKCPTPDHIVCQDRVTCASKCNNITECKGGEDERGCQGSSDISEVMKECTRYADELQKFVKSLFKLGLSPKIKGC